MGVCGSCCFKIGYTLYADTLVGRCVHNRYIKNFKQQYGENAAHSMITPFVYNDLMVVPIPVLANNYTYLVADIREKNFVLIDVGDASCLGSYTKVPDAILTTHKHWDHSGGNRDMRNLYPGLMVYGGVLDRVPNHTHRVVDGQKLKFGRLHFTALWTPGHTRGHIVWLLHGEPFGVQDSVFSGDTLMLAGCGAPFEGTVHKLMTSLRKLGTLAPNTLVWPGHEMALDGLELAVHIEHENLVAVLKLIWAATRREKMLCTCPSTIEEELSYNPFMRTRETSFLKAIGLEPLPTNIRPPKDDAAMDQLVFELILHKGHGLSAFKKKMKEKWEGNEVRSIGTETMLSEHQFLSTPISAGTFVLLPRTNCIITSSRPNGVPAPPSCSEDSYLEIGLNLESGVDAAQLSQSNMSSKRN